MNKLRLIIAIWAGKLVIIFSRLLGNQGSAYPGYLARRIYPDILRVLGSRIERETVIITGTNGKTTTSNLLASAIREAGFRLVHNQAGANMLAGITTAFINAAGFWGNNSFDYALLETDEANVPLLLNEIKADYLLVTNFFRDQLDRYGELDTMIGFIREAALKHHLELVLNADDPLSKAFQDKGLIIHFFSFAPTIYDSLRSQESREGRYCLLCGQELNYQRFHYAQLGKYTCPGCGQANPPAEYIGERLRMEPLVEFEVESTCIRSQYQGFFNAYNLLAAFAMSKTLGIGEPVIEKAFAAFRPQAGRMEYFEIQGKPCWLVLVKNPTGVNQSLSTVLNGRGSKNLLFALNDNAQDGRDVSWIWDADFELLEPCNKDIVSMVCSGQRSGDIAVRVKYAGLKAEKLKIIPDLARGIKCTLEEEGQLNYILCTYTALFAARKIMVDLQHKSIGNKQKPARAAGS
ncbi:MAG: MurT ligase domain-containing protein [Syntrophomonadaceae bacterium]